MSPSAYRDASESLPPKPAGSDVREPCEACGEETLHDVSIEIRTESEKRENAEFSREPYRVTTCNACGETASQRMNNA